MTSATTAIRQRVDAGGAGLIGYLPVGYPTLDRSIEAACRLVDAGFDVIEFGQPYSDPSMDGPAIQKASVRALEQGLRTDDVFTAVEAVSRHGGTVMTMTYYNLMFTRGVDTYARDLAAAGGVGVVTPDLPPEEGGEWEAAADAHNLERTYLVAPSSSDQRIAMICEHTRGWVYAASTMGVTGARSDVDVAARGLVERTRRGGADTVCVGFGVSRGEQAASIATYADGVIVGSALLQCLDGDWNEATARLDALARDLREATLKVER
ncbi:tryptophan synthase subunit alpha [Nanchangia anserum]|uniref:Tryptophan synthase alpha chain n=1 Tax=Nanchangia anserum TaxID=2692125 RepID=A0A8I0G7P5_9ACTO|nr:tryptophan synthase subunit alpha [Nanchangia anserum]MBD3688694.1 tryptophan synthase subunit alpha [Nanchangia anserum]QOX82442.1 tryptophan synthase subunit alpha [Nanchangia anserum]